MLNYKLVKKDIFVRSNSQLTDQQVLDYAINYVNEIQGNYSDNFNYVYAEIFDARNKKVIKVFSDATKLYLDMPEQLITQYDPAVIETISRTTSRDASYKVNFLELLDTPNDFTNQGNKLLAVMPNEEGLEFVEMPTFDLTLLDAKLNISDIVNSVNDTSIDKALSANQGKLLKDSIDTIQSILSSDDLTLDTVQEVITFIKANKDAIESLTDNMIQVDPTDISIAQGATNLHEILVNISMQLTALSNQVIPTADMIMLDNTTFNTNLDNTVNSLQDLANKVDQLEVSSTTSTTSDAIMPSYNTDEVLTTERWIDGKPIYRIVVQSTFNSSTTAKYIALDINYSQIVKIDIRTASTSNAVYNHTYFANASGAFYQILVQESNLRCTAWNSIFYNQPVTAILYYTKPTDTSTSPVAQVLAGSGSNSVVVDIGPVEYDTGRKRGGKIVYGLEVDCGAMPTSSTKQVAIPGHNPSHQYTLDPQESYTTNGFAVIPLPHSNSVRSKEANIWFYDGFIFIDTNGDFSEYVNTKIVVNYTK